ncbi:hypothetical protein N7468_001517, partial [Penicillium chermesinum]
LSDNDSTYPGSVDDASYTESVTSSALKYRSFRSFFRTAAGTIHTMKEEYVLPNDEQEQDRLDLSHHLYLMLLKGELYQAPIKNPRRVLDLGTGTGIWAMDFADAHPDSEVVGIDLSPIQPSWVPPNCRFEIDDFEQEWSYNHGFDYIHGRELEGCIRDHDQLFRRAFENLNPGGWLEMATIEVNTLSDDGTHLNVPCLLDVVKYVRIASKKFGKDMASVSTWKTRLETAGFTNVTENIMKLPQNPWPKDAKLKELGRYHQLNLLEAMPPYTYALFTRMLGWKRVQIETLLAGVRHELKDTSNHIYTKVYIVYGQKPE